MGLYSFIFAPLVDKDGTQLPFSRADVIGSVITALALMYAFAFSLGNMTLSSSLKCIGALGVAGMVIILTKQRRLVFGAALSIIAMRLVFGLIFIVHSPAMLLASILCCGLAIMLLRER